MRVSAGAPPFQELEVRVEVHGAKKTQVVLEALIRMREPGPPLAPVSPEEGSPRIIDQTPRVAP